MPSTRRQHHEDLPLFLLILGLAFALWLVYRLVLPAFPVWFDETIGKALFFGLPVWLYLILTRDDSVLKSFSWDKFEQGILMGLAVGGMYGFVTSVIFLMMSGGEVQSAQLFLSTQFWNEFLLAMCTAFWETLLFFCFTQTVIERIFPKWSVLQVVLTVSLVFVAFHLPNMVLRADALAVGWQVVLLSFFALGQSLIFYQTKNAYALVLSQAFWGMVLLTHSL